MDPLTMSSLMGSGQGNSLDLGSTSSAQTGDIRTGDISFGGGAFNGGFGIGKILVLTICALLLIKVYKKGGK